MRAIDTKEVYQSFIAGTGFFYENGPRMIVVSVLWFLCSLPIITLGPATLAAYAAIATLREGYSVDRTHVVATVKRHGVSAALLTGVPLVFLAISILYTRQYFIADSMLPLALGVVTAYAAGYTGLLLIPAFIALATGDSLEIAIRRSVRWTGQNAVSVVMMAMGTFLVAVVTGLLTIAFVLVFAGVSFSFHLETVLGPPTDDPTEIESWSPYSDTRREG